jgi:catechol 2,3-dioxygenase-like lactoylglutathione lyase family enzyme
MAAPGTPKILFDLQQYVQPPGKAAAIALGDVGHSHICFETEALADTCEALRRDGIELVSDPVTFQLESGELSVVFLKDPDGNIVELVQYPR